MKTQKEKEDAAIANGWRLEFIDGNGIDRELWVSPENLCYDDLPEEAYISANASDDRRRSNSINTMSNQTKTDSGTNGVAVRSIGLVGASSVESEVCPRCEGKGYVPMWDGEGNEVGEETCYRCLGMGRVERIAPTSAISGHWPERNPMSNPKTPTDSGSLDRIVGAFLPPNDVAIAKKWVSRMMDEDPVYREWASKYPGKTDNGIEAELWEVCPGIILNGPVGYWKVNSLAALTFPWKWRFDARPFPCSNSSHHQRPEAEGCREFGG